jgi:hypothetical protein
MRIIPSFGYVASVKIASLIDSTLWSNLLTLAHQSFCSRAQASPSLHGLVNSFFYSSYVKLKRAFF